MNDYSQLSTQVDGSFPFTQTEFRHKCPVPFLPLNGKPDVVKDWHQLGL